MIQTVSEISFWGMWSPSLGTCQSKGFLPSSSVISSPHTVEIIEKIDSLYFSFLSSASSAVSETHIRSSHFSAIKVPGSFPAAADAYQAWSFTVSHTGPRLRWCGINHHAQEMLGSFLAPLLVSFLTSDYNAIISPTPIPPLKDKVRLNYEFKFCPLHEPIS